MTRNTDLFYISPLTADQSEVTAHVYADMFLRDEPLTHTRAIEPEVFSPLAAHYLDLCAKAGMSFVARGAGAQSPAGFLLASDVCEVWQEDDLQMTTMYEIFSDCVALISRLENEFLKKYSLKPGDGYHIVQVGIVPLSRRKGLATSLIRHALEHAKKQGYRLILAESTSVPSRNCFLKAGFTDFYSISYKTYSDGKKSPYTGLPGEISLMVRWL